MKHFIVLIFTVASAIAWAQNKPQIEPPAQPLRANLPSAHSGIKSGAPSPTYEPTEPQKLKLENAQLKLVVVALQIQPLEQKRQEQLAALSQLCEAVVKENHWPENVKCDPATLAFKESQPGAAHDPRLAGAGEPESSTASRDRSTALQPKTDRQPVPAQPTLSTDPRQ